MFQSSEPGFGESKMAEFEEMKKRLRTCQDEIYKLKAANSDVRFPRLIFRQCHVCTSTAVKNRFVCNAKTFLIYLKKMDFFSFLYSFDLDFLWPVTQSQNLEDLFIEVDSDASQATRIFTLSNSVRSPKVFVSS